MRPYLHMHFSVSTNDNILAAIFWYGSVAGLSLWSVHYLWHRCHETTAATELEAAAEVTELEAAAEVTELEAVNPEPGAGRVATSIDYAEL